MSPWDNQIFLYWNFLSEIYKQMILFSSQEPVEVGMSDEILQKVSDQYFFQILIGLKLLN